MIAAAVGDLNIDGCMICEMNLMKDTTMGTIKLVNPRPRVAKKVPNSLAVVKTAVAGSRAGLLDATSVSFSMRERV